MRIAFRSRLRELLVASVLGCSLFALAGCGSAGPDFSPAVLSEAEAAEMIEAEIERRWEQLASQYPDAVRPQVEVVRTVDSHEWAEVVAACMNDNGFDASASRDGGLTSGTILAGQLEPYEMQLFACKAMYPLDPKYRLPFTEEQLKYLYWYYTNELRDCLEERGYEVTEPPSEVRFLETFATAAGWSPYDGILPRSQDAYLDLYEACPETPPELYGR